MAVRIDAAGDYLERSTLLPGVNSFTIFGWQQVVVDQGTGTYQPLVVFGSASGLESNAIFWSFITTGNMRLSSGTGGVEASGADFPSKPAVGTEFAWYLKCSGTGAGQLEAGWRAKDSDKWIVVTATESSGTNNQIRFSNLLVTYYLNSRAWGIKCWDRALSIDEIQKESESSQLLNPNRINFFWPLPHHANTRDASQGGRHATVGGALATEYTVTEIAQRAADVALYQKNRRRRWLKNVAATHATTGALASDAAAVAGTAVHLTLHATSGALASDAATVAGTAAHQHATTGALAAQDASTAGTAAHLTLHTSTGALAADVAVIAGTAAHVHATTGALAAADATIAGAATNEGTSHSTTGALSADAATIAGTATHLTLHATTGALAAQAAVIAGVAAHHHAATGALAADSATIAGTATHLTLHATTGALAADAATIAGDAALEGTAHATTGAMAAQDATIAGTAAHNITHATSGVLQAESATIAGLAQLGTQIVVGDSPTGGWYEPLFERAIRERRRKTKKELLDERIAIEELPARTIESLPAPTKAKVKKAGTVTLRALLGPKAEEMTSPEIAAELDKIEARSRKLRRQREDEELLLL